MQAPRDVWIGIMHHFRISLSKDKADDIKAKKRTLLSLALTHPKLTDIALDELWKSMTSLIPIALNVINDNSVTAGVVLHWGYDCWDLAYLSNSDRERLVSRASSYLARIQSIYLVAFPSQQEYMLWHALSAFEPSSPLCPRLRELSIVIGANYASLAYHVTPLLTSSSLKSIQLHASPHASESEVAASIILDILRFRNIEISDIVYTGYTSPTRIIPRIMCLPSLISIAIPSGRSGGDEATSARIVSFQEMRGLTTVEINLDHYLDDALREVGKWFETLVSLSSLTLRGSLQKIRRCIQDRNPMASICSFGLYVQTPDRQSRDGRTARLVPLLSAILPNLRSLHLEVRHNNGGLWQLTQLTLNDLLSFRERPMQTLILRRCLTLTDPSNDLVEIIKVWPTLQRLCIESTSGVGSASEVLPFISRSAPSLQDATLPLQFSPVWAAPTTNEVVCPLQHLGFSLVSGLSFNFPETLELARNLIELFPRLRAVSMPDSGDPGSLRNLQVAIKTLQDVIASPPRRPDRLFR